MKGFFGLSNIKSSEYDVWCWCWGDRVDILVVSCGGGRKEGGGGG
jgi:hypothetical protein